MGTLSVFSHHLRKELLLLGFVEFVILTLSCFFVLTAQPTLLYPGQELLSSKLILRSLTYSIVMLLSLIAMGSYPDPRGVYEGIPSRIFASFVLGTTIFFILFSIFPLTSLSAKTLFVAHAISLTGIGVVRLLVISPYSQRTFRRRVLVLGSGRIAKSLLEMENEAERRGCDIQGFVTIAGSDTLVDSQKVIPRSGPLSTLAIQHRIDEIVMALDERRGFIPFDELSDCETIGVHVSDTVGFFEREFGKLRTDLILPSQLLFTPGFQPMAMYASVRRILDVTAATVLLLLLWPVLLITVLCILFEDGWASPVIYRQTRVGKNGRLFEILKFRSMRMDAESDQKPRWAAINDTRITRVGAVIRRHRIDELPQLFNVLRGDMGFVGPRPERPEFVEKLTKTILFYHLRQRIKPGITGWAQLRYPYGDSEKDATEKLQYDLYYIKNRSLFLDFIIVLQTLEVVLFGRGAR